MNDLAVRRLTRAAGVLIGIGATLLVPLYFMYSGPPPAWNVLTRNLINILLAAVLLLFISGFCHLIRQAGDEVRAVADLTYGAGVVHVAIILVATSLEAGGVFGSPNGTIDPTIDGPLAHGNALTYGSIGRVLNAVFLASAGYAAMYTRLLPAWLGRSGYAIALLNVAFVPSIYFGMDPARFYSAIGWGNSAFAASLMAYWVAAAGIAMRRTLPGATR